MVMQPTEKMFVDTFIKEHKAMLQQSSEICELLNKQISSFSIEFQNKTIVQVSIEEMITWKSALKKIIWGLWDNIQDHVERETAFIDSLTERRTRLIDLKRNEEVLEHLDEMAWLIDNTSARQMPRMLDYIQRKMAELCQGIDDHCQWGNEVLKEFEESEQVEC